MYNEIRLQIKRLREKREGVFDSIHSAETDKLFSFFTRIVAKVTSSERCSVFIYDPANHKVWLKAGTGVQEHGIEVPIEGSVVGKVISSGEPLVITNRDDIPGATRDTDEKTGFMTRNILCVPIRSPRRSEITGAFEILNKENGAEFTDEDMALAREIAEHLQAHVDMVFLNQEVLGLTEQLYASVMKVTKLLVGTVAALLLVLFLVMAGYVSLPALLG